jgi:hypothetical protein
MSDHKFNFLIQYLGFLGFVRGGGDDPIYGYPFTFEAWYAIYGVEDV